MKSINPLVKTLRLSGRDRWWMVREMLKKLPRMTLEVLKAKKLSVSDKRGSMRLLEKTRQDSTTRWRRTSTKTRRKSVDSVTCQLHTAKGRSRLGHPMSRWPGSWFAIRVEKDGDKSEFGSFLVLFICPFLMNNLSKITIKWISFF